MPVSGKGVVESSGGTQDVARVLRQLGEAKVVWPVEGSERRPGWVWFLLRVAGPWKRSLPTAGDNDLAEFEAGRGYWLKVGQDCELVIKYY